MKLKLIEDWKRAPRLGSVQLAAFAGVLAAIITANQGLALGLVGMLPQGKLRIFAAAAIGLVVFVIPALSRILQKAPKP